MAQLILECALRGMALTAIAWILLRLLRVRDTRTQFQTWTLVLGVSILMPILGQWLRIPLVLPYAASASRNTTLVLESGTLPAAPASWNLAEGLWMVYLAVAALLLARVAWGLATVWNLWRKAEPLADGVRVSRTLRSPVTCGSTVLVPEEFPSWDGWKQRAVLAHEFSHVERGDFWVQTAAAIYRAVFWFQPLSWVLFARIAGLAEDLSDTAAVDAMEDRARYAEVLLGMAAEGPVLALPMARPATVSRRIERVLSHAAETRVGLLRKAALTLAALGVAWLCCGLQMQLAAAPQADQAAEEQAPPPPPPPPPPAKAKDTPPAPPPPPPPPAGSGRTSISIQDNQIRFEKDGRKYLVTDPATVKQVQEIMHSGHGTMHLSQSGGEPHQSHKQMQEMQHGMHAHMEQLHAYMAELQAKVKKLVEGSGPKAEVEANLRKIEKDMEQRGREMEKRALEMETRAAEMQKQAVEAQERAKTMQANTSRVWEVLEEAIRNGVAKAQ